MDYQGETPVVGSCEKRGPENTFVRANKFFAIAVSGSPVVQDRSQGNKGGRAVKLSMRTVDDVQRGSWVVEKIKQIQRWVGDDLYADGVNSISTEGVRPPSLFRRNWKE